MSNELKSIINGTVATPSGHLIQAALNFLRTSKKTSRAVEKSEFFNKKSEVTVLKDFAQNHEIFFYSLNNCRYLAEGAEQKVYWCNDGKHVLKTNDGIFYESWEDYMVNLLIHNYLFPQTSYELVGFLEENNSFFAVVKQVFIASTEPTNLDNLKELLIKLGFSHKKNNDYFHSEWGIILEDLHDENVLTNNGVFFFIDTVLYET